MTHHTLNQSKPNKSLKHSPRGLRRYWQGYGQYLNIHFKKLSDYHNWTVLTQAYVTFLYLPHLTWLVIVFALYPLLLNPKVILFKNQDRVLQLVFLTFGIAAAYQHFGTFFGVEFGVNFLFLCMLGKSVELNNRRDYYVLLHLFFFLLACLFLLSQGALTAFKVLIGVLAILYAMMTFFVVKAARLRVLGVLVVQAIPLMVILFLFFPRLSPLWTINVASGQAKTGMSDSMSPGDFSNLSQSTQLAFRVEFDATLPEKSQLYWRGLVFSNFDGVTWRPDNYADRSFKFANQDLQKRLNDAPAAYKVLLEATGQPWLFGLDYPYSSQPQIRLTQNFTLKYHNAITSQLAYQVKFLPATLINQDQSLSQKDRQANLALPNTGNPKAHDFAKQMFAKAKGDPETYIHLIRQWIQEDQFRYTLSPPKLFNDRIDEFLFNTKAGFCEHYSSSFTFLMRTVGIPARVVVGYQGGELGRDGKSWEVRQMDAHAWSEVWLQDKGWVRVDPTAFVAPDRIERGISQITQEQGAEFFGSGVAGQVSYQQFRLMQSLHRLSDQIGYYWQKEIVGYDQEKQNNTLAKLFNIKNLMQQLAIMLTGFAILFALIFITLWYRQRPKYHPLDKPIITLSQQLSPLQLGRQESEGVLAWLERLQNQPNTPNSIHQALQELQSLYRQVRYSQNNPDPNALKKMQQISQQIAQSYKKTHKNLKKDLQKTQNLLE